MSRFYCEICRAVLFVALICNLSACDTRRELIEEKRVWVRVSLDWSQADISPDGASVWFFPQTWEGDPRVLLTNNTLDSISLPRGSYSVLAFNETVSGHNYISFRGTDRYYSFEAFANPITVTGKYTRNGEEETAVSTPDILAAAHQDRFDITTDMILTGRGLTLEFEPKRQICTVILKVHIKGMHNTATSGHAASLSGMAEGVFLATETTNAEPAVHYFTLSTRTFYPNSGIDGTMSAAFYAFGLTDMELTRAAERQNLLSFYFLLRNGSDYILSDIDVTENITVVEGTTELVLDIELGQEGAPSVTLPDVPDTGNGSSGFDVDVNSWGEQVVIPLPL